MAVAAIGCAAPCGATQPLRQGLARATSKAKHLVTRDLPDSVAELNFLERHLAISQRTAVVVLDIGAGYGRLAYRSVVALPLIERYLCTDAVPVSTFNCEHYLRYRGVDAGAKRCRRRWRYYVDV